MTMEQMHAGYQQLYGRFLSDRGIADASAPTCATSSSPDWQRRLFASPAVDHGRAAPGPRNRPGRARWWAFTRSVANVTPRQLPIVLTDWVSGLSMKSYAERYILAVRDKEASRFERRIARIRARLANLIEDGALQLTLENVRNALPSLSLTLRKKLDASAVSRAARYVKWLLRKTRTTITLRIECDVAAAEELIERLARIATAYSIARSGRSRRRARRLVAVSGDRRPRATAARSSSGFEQGTETLRVAGPLERHGLMGRTLRRGGSYAGIAGSRDVLSVDAIDDQSDFSVAQDSLPCTRYRRDARSKLAPWQSCRINSTNAASPQARRCCVEIASGMGRIGTPGRAECRRELLRAIRSCRDARIRR